MIVLPGRGVLIDTPGMRELQLWTEPDSAAEAFDDIEALAAGCRFTDCRHRDEPKCAVKQAVEEGTISAERLASYLKLQDELDTPDGQSLYLSAGLVWAANELGLVPSGAEVYDFAVPPILGGEQVVTNVDVIDFITALGISGQIHEQLRDVPPGTPIRLQFDDPID